MATEESLSKSVDSPALLDEKSQGDIKQHTGELEAVTQYSLAYKFVAVWFLFVAVLFGLAFVSNIDWSKPFLQTQLGYLLHRNVKLGHLAWNLSQNGLAVETNQLSITEADGSNFFKAAHAEMGIAFVPLLKKQLIIRHVQFTKPEVWAVRIKKNIWNFDDLLEMDNNIRFVEADHGIVHFVDRMEAREPAWAPFTIEDTHLQLVYPIKNKQTPVHLSFVLKRPAYVTKFSFTGIGGGPKNWKGNTYNFETDVEHLNLEDFAPFVRAVADIEPHFEVKPAQVDLANGSLSVASPEPVSPQKTVRTKSAMPLIAGAFDVKLKGSGVFEQGLTAKLNVKATDFVLSAPSIGIVSAPHAASESTVYIDREKMSWHDLVFKVGNVELKSHGQIKNWKLKGSEYQAEVAGRIKRLSDLTGMLDQKSRKIQTKRGEIDVDPGSFAGAADIAISASNSGSDDSIVTNVDTNGLTLKPFIIRNAAHLAPMMTLLGLQDTSQLTGKFKIIPGKKLEIVQGCLPLARGTVATSGFIDLKDSVTHLKFEARHMQLSELRKSATGSKYISKDLRQVFSIPNKERYVVAGELAANGTVDTTPMRSVTAGEGSVHNFCILARDCIITMSGVNGKFHWTGKKLELERLDGKIAAGSYSLVGYTGLEKTPYLDWHMTAKHLDLAQLGALMRLLQIKVPLFSENHLYGTVSSLDLHIKGPRNCPSLMFQAVPENMFYKPPGMEKPLRADSGLIVYKNDNLILDDVTFISNQDRIHTSLTITNLSHDAALTDLRIKTAGIDLSEVNYYLSSAIMPAPLKKIYLGFLHKNSIFGVKGRTATDIACQFRGDKVALNGTVTLHDVSAKVLQPDMPVEHINGVIATNGSNLVLKDLKGTFKKTAFVLAGSVMNYMEPKPLWKTNLTASLTPEDIFQMLPPMREQFKKWQLDMHSQDPLDLTADFETNGDDSHVVFNLKADSSDRLSIETPLGVFYQPARETFVVDGIVKANKDSCELQSAKVQIGDSVLLVSGKLGSGVLFGSDSQGSADSRAVNVSVVTQSPVPANRLLSIIDPSLSKEGATGFVEGKFNLDGSVPDLRPSGKITMTKICIPRMNVEDLTGVISMPESLAGESMAKNILAVLELPQLKLGGSLAKKLHANVTFVEKTDKKNQANIQLTDGKAEIAGGTIDWTAILDVRKNSINAQGTFTDLRATEISEQLFSRAGEITGTINGLFDFNTSGKTYKESIANLNGHIEFAVGEGFIARFGRLETQLTRVNLLHQGIFGFNLNNLLQSVVPTRTGTFRDISGALAVERGILSVESLKFNADDLCLWAGGKANLKSGVMDMKVAGRIPRVSESLLSGAFGGASRNITLQRFVTVATFGRLQRLPTLPVLGDIGSDRPRTFQFKVAAPLDKPKLLSQSIEKSFHWLPGHPSASAHPIVNAE